MASQGLSALQYINWCGFTGAHHTAKAALLQIGKILALAIAAANLKPGQARKRQAVGKSAVVSKSNDFDWPSSRASYDSKGTRAMQYQL